MVVLSFQPGLNSATFMTGHGLTSRVTDSRSRSFDSLNASVLSTPLPPTSYHAASVSRVRAPARSHGQPPVEARGYSRRAHLPASPAPSEVATILPASRPSSTILRRAPCLAALRPPRLCAGRPLLAVPRSLPAPRRQLPAVHAPPATPRRQRPAVRPSSPPPRRRRRRGRGERRGRRSAALRAARACAVRR